jgi:phosphoribosylaminoimidazole-succinocarboxamide synthase
MHYAERGYRGEGEPPRVEPELWVQACKRYIQIYESLTGLGFVPGEYPVNPRIEKQLRKEGILK